MSRWLMAQEFGSRKLSLFANWHNHTRKFIFWFRTSVVFYPIIWLPFRWPTGYEYHPWPVLSNVLGDCTVISVLSHFKTPYCTTNNIKQNIWCCFLIVCIISSLNKSLTVEKVGSHKSLECQRQGLPFCSLRSTCTDSTYVKFHMSRSSFQSHLERIN